MVKCRAYHCGARVGMDSDRRCNWCQNILHAVDNSKTTSDYDSLLNVVACLMLGGAENAGVENAGVENAGAITYGKPSE